MNSKLVFSIATTLMLFAFQNCGQEYASATYNISSNRGNAMDPGKVAVGPAVWPRTDSTVTNPVPLSVSRQALPTAIDFDHNQSYDESNMAISWGNWISSWKEMPQEYHAYLGEPRYNFRLDFFKYAVIDLKTDTIVYRLSAGEVGKLKNLAASSILASARQFGATADCAPSDAAEYASLETDYGMFDLGAGAPCATIDLYKNNGSGQSAGLKDLLKRIAKKI